MSGANYVRIESAPDLPGGVRALVCTDGGDGIEVVIPGLTGIDYAIRPGGSHVVTLTLVNVDFVVLEQGRR